MKSTAATNTTRALTAWDLCAVIWGSDGDRMSTSATIYYNRICGNQGVFTVFAVGPGSRSGQPEGKERTLCYPTMLIAVTPRRSPACRYLQTP